MKRYKMALSAAKVIYAKSAYPDETVNQCPSAQESIAHSLFYYYYHSFMILQDKQTSTNNFLRTDDL